MTFEYINRTYNLNFKNGSRVVYTGDSVPEYGTVVGTHDAYLEIKIDGDAEAECYHPTWKLQRQDETSGKIDESEKGE